MSNKFKVTLRPSGEIVEVEEGRNLLEALREKNIYIKSSCGGHATCSDCVLKVVSCEDYITNCKKNGMDFGVTRFTPKQDADYVFTNYQFLQVLNLNQEDIKKLCKKTIDYLNGIILENVDYSLLYLLGKISNNDFDENIYENIHDNVTKAILLNNNLLKDPYVQNHLVHSLNKKIKESYVGNLIVDGNYSMCISDHME